MKTNKDCNCKTKKNVDNIIKKFDKSKNKTSKKSGFSYVLKFLFYTFLIIMIIILSIPLIIYIIRNKKPITIRNNKLLRL